MHEVKIRLSGGQRDGEIVGELPEEFIIVRTERFEEPDENHDDIVHERHRFVAVESTDELAAVDNFSVGPH